MRAHHKALEKSGIFPDYRPGLRYALVNPVFIMMLGRSSPGLWDRIEDDRRRRWMSTRATLS